MTRPASGRAARISLRQRQNVFEARAVSQSALAGALDDGSVGKRIAERNAQLDHIRARIDRRNGNFARRVQTRIAGRQINNQARLVIETNRH